MAAYVVEAILDHEQRDDGMYYYVKWKGYDNPADNTWEPEDSFMKPFILLDKYKAEHQQDESDDQDDDTDDDEEGCRAVDDKEQNESNAASGSYCSIL